MTDTITIRAATYADRAAIERLAALDDGRAPWDDYVLAFVNGELRAALPIGGGRPLADPFHLTEGVVNLLRVAAGGQPAHVAGGRRPRLHLRTAEVAV
jgi:hypothetical protein